MNLPNKIHLIKFKISTIQIRTKQGPAVLKILTSIQNHYTILVYCELYLFGAVWSLLGTDT